MSSKPNLLYVVQHMYNDRYHSRSSDGLSTEYLVDAKFMTKTGAQNVVKRLRNGGDKNWNVRSVSISLNPWSAKDNP